jgi:hypothetical protein
MMSDMMTEDHDMGMSNASTTIDPSVVQSRILQSASLAKEDTTMEPDDGTKEQPTFPQLSAMAARGGKAEYRRVRCPPHRYTPLRENWEQILTPLVEFLKLQASDLLCIYTVYNHNVQRRKIAIERAHRVVPGTAFADKPTGKPLCLQRTHGAAFVAV